MGIKNLDPLAGWNTNWYSILEINFKLFYKLECVHQFSDFMPNRSL